ncbi:unnamed protein product [Discula destructiva]
MAPQSDIPTAATVLGTIGTVLWCVQLVPQIWTNWRTKTTDGMPASMMFLWALCGVPFGVYAIVQKFNVPIQVQPQVFMCLCIVSWAQSLIYFHKWVVWKAATLAAATLIVFGGVEAALILTIQPLYHVGNETPVLVVGIIAAILLAAGLLPPYGEIWKRKGRVIGINWIFLTMDWNGAFFSLMALVAQNTFDVLGGVLYIVCCLLEAGIFASHFVWLLRTRKIRREAAAQGKTFDHVLAEHKESDAPFKFAERKSRRNRKENKRSAVEMDVEEGAGMQEAASLGL